MEQFKRVKVVMLPTEKGTSSIAKSINQDILSLYNKNDDKYNQWINQNLYIISDDEIKEGDWCITGLKIIRKCKSILYSNNNFKSINGYEFEDGTKDTRSSCKKIIATTDISLEISNKIICDYCGGSGSRFSPNCKRCKGTGKIFNFIKLPQPSQQFIERFIESYNAGQVIDDVLVEYELSYEASKIIEHHINKIPKLKVDKNNTITIKKLKDSWNREEVIALLNKLNNTLNIVKESERGYQTLKEWIEKHL